MKYPLFTFCLAAFTLPAMASDVGKVTLEKVDQTEMVYSVDEMTDARARMTYRFLSTMSKDSKALDSVDGKDLISFRGDKDAVTEKTAKYHFDMCTSLSGDTTFTDSDVYSLFGKLEALDAYELEQQKMAISNLPINLLNSIQSYQSKSMVTITPESIVRDYPKQWLTDQRKMCFDFIIDNQKLADNSL